MRPILLYCACSLLGRNLVQMHTTMASLFGAKQSSDEFTQRSSEADEAGEKFTELFFETLDKRRHLISGFYFDRSSMVWNGNSTQGADNIATVYMSFPVSEHIIQCLDCQPLGTSRGQDTVLVTCQGQVKYEGENDVHSFTQNFMLTKQGDVWKVASDCFRFVDE